MGRRSRAGLVRIAVLLGAVSVLMLCAAQTAHGFVYWSNNDSDGSIGRANLDGGGVTQSFVPGPIDFACGVAVDGSHVYWGIRDGNAIGRANLDGSSPNPAFITGITGPCGVAVDGSHIYWANLAGTTIGRADLSGSNVNNNFIPGASSPCGVAVDGAHVYWVNSEAGTQTVGRADLGGGNVNQSFIPSNAGCFVAVDGAHVYWGNAISTAIRRSDLAGNGQQDLVTGLGGAFCGVAVDASHVYWTNDGPGSIGRANLDGSAPNFGFVPGGGDNPCGVAVDAGVPATQTPAIAGPSKVRKCKRKKRKHAHSARKKCRKHHGKKHH
jgi:hypothetical protein